ncbi:hypothetical protein KV697_05555 [Sphingomonas sanguinis]|uniref:DUF6624 domain-containing protein n=1 Tax=Sphingomonas sanguinis TaxID=33051 RepID=UPI001C56FCED|nr:DUF6624 domain-containing protein [Sphingomonas sanguinis]QXT36772.1 hypothetical protein KV697_05555 [Sphingomonas sanguinis]
MRMLSLIFSVFLLTAATPPIPDVLKPYIKGDRFDPGDYKWMKGRFPDATPEEKAQDKQVRDWLKASYMAALDDTRAELLVLGVTDPQLKGAPVGGLLYSQVSSFIDTSLWSSFAAFQQSLETARPIADTYLLAVKTAKQISESDTSKLHDQLMARPMGEQMLRYSSSWGSGDMADAPAVTEPVKAIILSRLMTALRVEDRENTEWLKQIVAKQGWPKRSEVGDDAARQAWLLVQHADADPAFQLAILRAMESLVPHGEVSKKDYAYLYDRVMLKISGKQRYGTQAMCNNGTRVSQPLEDDKAVDRLRTEVGLAPVAEYLGGMDKSFGRCPPGTRP